MVEPSGSPDPEPGTPTPHGSCRPIGVVQQEKQNLFWSTTMNPTTLGTLARFTLARFTIYRTLRHFAGPLLAFRLAFAGRTEA